MEPGGQAESHLEAPAALAAPEAPAATTAPASSAAVAASAMAAPAPEWCETENENSLIQWPITATTRKVFPWEQNISKTSDTV